MTPQETKTETFTVGPWRFEPCSQRKSREFYVRAPEARAAKAPCPAVARVLATDSISPSQRLANARLIAAAPAMYAALERAHVVIRDALTLRVPIDGDAEATLKAIEDAQRLALEGAP